MQVGRGLPAVERGDLQQNVIGRSLGVFNEDVKVTILVEDTCVDGNRSRGGACPPPRNVAAKELAITDSLKSATLWGGVGGGETRQITVSRPSGP